MWTTYYFDFAKISDIERKGWSICRGMTVLDCALHVSSRWLTIPLTHFLFSPRIETILEITVSNCYITVMKNRYFDYPEFGYGFRTVIFGVLCRFRNGSGIDSRIVLWLVKCLRIAWSVKWGLLDYVWKTPITQFDKFWLFFRFVTFTSRFL